jgi:ATP/ADP translocase
MNNDAEGNYKAARVFTWLIAPFIVMAFLVVVTLQRGDAKKNLSRYFLESYFMNFLGYVSYPICKLLHLLVDILLIFNSRVP